MGIEEQIADRNKQADEFNKSVEESKKHSAEYEKTPVILIPVSAVFKGIAAVLTKASPLLASEKLWGPVVKFLGEFFEGLSEKRKTKV